jgi:hypothetical protein
LREFARATPNKSAAIGPECRPEAAREHLEIETGSALEEDHDESDRAEDATGDTQVLRPHQARHRPRDQPDEDQQQDVGNPGALEQRGEEVREDEAIPGQVS